MAVFPSIANPSKITPKVSYRILSNKFGDGYEQFSPDGINIKETTFSLNWAILSLTDYDALESFLDAQTPVNAFTWTNPTNNQQYTVRFLKDSFTSSQSNVHWLDTSLTLKTAYGT